MGLGIPLLVKNSTPSTPQYTRETIVALSTPVGNGAIGILRLSGEQALSLLSKVWAGTPPADQFEPRHVYTGPIHKLAQETLLDQVITFWMKAPHSYTGEDLVEIQGHGGQRVMEALLENFIKAGARMAEPGEFTKRAFLNGRMDLAQAEAVADLIQATSTRAVELASRQLEGRLSEFVSSLRNDLKVMRAQMEAMIDFPEDEDVQGLHDFEIRERIHRVIQQIQKLLETYREGRSFREGIRVAILGKPNVGKSSLFNALLQEDRAIVHPTPGTTRDLIEESLEIQGLIVRFIDTAGIRQGKDLVESEGIRRTQNRIRQADLILAVIDASRPLDDEDKKVFDMVQGTNACFILNKTDLPGSCGEKDLRDFSPSTPIFPLSAKSGEGISRLKEAIFHYFVKNETKPSDIILTNVRHRTALVKGLEFLEKVKESSSQKRSLEYLVADLNFGIQSLGEITGEVTHDEILGEIFSRFCLGK